MRCIKCKKFLKENTQGNLRYCQGHTIWDSSKEMERDCMNCEKTFTTTYKDNYDHCKSCR